ncbi:hypothetical protein HD806DRAFT_474942 [Xylariaceae sp. AK1471]|nr:hypothetical protein HD806DRAFT_474942 [Xylariaceae sp. AK1471]
MVIAGGVNQKIHLLDLTSGQQVTIGSHDAPVRGIRSVDVPPDPGIRRSSSRMFARLGL